METRIDLNANPLGALVAMINATNRMGVIANLQGGSYRPGMLASLAG